jgi:enoyl-CoA hydratase
LAEDRLDRSALVAATLAARVYAPQEAVSVGYLDSVVPVDEVEDTAVAEARRLGAYSSRAYAQTKETLRAPTIARVREHGTADLARFTVEPPG